jgi:2-dehydro-3-deoxyphosphogluconate aldolase/(4S)-4-hydroxy-2-oxoglutarate aldolase
MSAAAAMDKAFVRTQIDAIGIIPAVRTSSAADARFAAEAVWYAGLPIVEITMTVPQALEVVADLAEHLPHLVVGAGTVLDLESARRCIDAGSKFLTSPALDLDIVEFAVERQVLVIPGALTPSEVTAAWRAGADYVKIFPSAMFGGAAYIRALRAPFPHVRFIAAGGVTQQTAAEFILAGATAIGVGAELIPRRAIEGRQQDWITELARRFMGLVRDARRLTMPHPAESSDGP